MAYQHGVYTRELPTSIIPPVNTLAGLPVFFGTAPVHLASDLAQVNRPILCYSYAEAVAAFGYSDDWEKYTLCEAIYSQFALFAVAPVVFINVLDISTHKTVVTGSAKNIVNGIVTIEDAVILSSLKVKLTEQGQDLVVGIDYEAIYNNKEQLIITALDVGQITTDKTSLWISYDAVDATAVTTDDIIGGIDINSGKAMGLEVLNDVFTLYQIVPGMVLAPGWTQDPEVSAVLTAKVNNINAHFTAIALTDIDTKSVKKYTDATAWKNTNNYVNSNQVVCYPMVKLGDKKYHLSTQLAGVAGLVDAANGDIPNESPSNKNIQATGLCLADGSEILIGSEQANYLNSQGIVTALNFIGGWKLWGNRTACYPANTDFKDAFISSRRMLNWHSQTFILTYWSKVDKPITRRLIDTIVDSENIRLNGLTAKEAILGGEVKFMPEENPTTDLLDGKITFHTYILPPPPARVITNLIEVQPSYFKTLF